MLRLIAHHQKIEVDAAANAGFPVAMHMMVPNTAMTIHGNIREGYHNGDG